MKDKNNRHRSICKAITEQKIGSQEKLMKVLQAEGFELTQATLSRDLKSLQIAKVHSPTFGYSYIMPPNKAISKEYTNFGKINNSITISFSNNLAVLKTRPGYAGSVAYDIDNNVSDSILGTIAGDDTVLAVLKQNVVKDEIIEELEKLFTHIIEIK